MPKISYGGQSYESNGQSVLDSLTAQGVSIPHGCRSGICHSCLMCAVEGEIPAESQAGLRPAQVEKNYFLACTCIPKQDIKVALPDDAMGRYSARVTRIERLNADVIGIRLKTEVPFDYLAGQFVNLYKDADTVRSYSLASVPALDEELFLNVRKVPGGVMTGWLFDGVQEGDTLTISEASGDCYYEPGRSQQNILLIGTGSGLAPLYGILREALRCGHTGSIRLYQGNNTVEGFYLEEELRALEAAHPNFSYVPCVSAGTVPDGYVQGMVHEVALTENPKISGWRVYLCGNPLMVKAAQQKAFLAGASLSEIFADPFG